MKKLAIVACICILLAQFAWASAPARIVSISPGFTEILYALGLDQQIVGTTNFCDYPEKAKHTAKIGDVVTPNLEKIISLHPDLVICGAWRWQLPENLRKVGIQVLEIKDAQNLNDTFQTIQTIGHAVERDQQAAGIVAAMKKQLSELQEQSGKKKVKPRVFVELDLGNWTIGSTSYMSQLLEIAGMENIFDDRKDAYMMVTMESIVSRNPDLILSLDRTKDDYSKSESWKSLPAVQRGLIVDKNALDWNAVTRQGPRLVQGIKQLSDLVDKMWK